jgi:Spy/CpxP family protein refolding chaperone
MLIGIGALAGVLIANVSAHSGFGGHGAWGSRGHHYHEASSIEQIREPTLDKAAWVLGSVDATPEQSKRVKAIVVALVDEIYPLRQQHRENRRSVKEALSQPQIDRHAAFLAMGRAHALKCISAIGSVLNDVKRGSQRDTLLTNNK